MPEICLQKVEDTISFSSIHKCYIEGCKGAIETSLIEASIKIRDMILDRLLEPDFILQEAAFYNLSLKAFIKNVKEGKTPIKFLGAEIWGKKDLADNEMRFYSAFRNVHLIFNDLV